MLWNRLSRYDSTGGGEWDWASPPPQSLRKFPYEAILVYVALRLLQGSLSCLYFASSSPPVPVPLLHLLSTGMGVAFLGDLLIFLHYVGNFSALSHVFFGVTKFELDVQAKRLRGFVRLRL